MYSYKLPIDTYGLSLTVFELSLHRVCSTVLVHYRHADLRSEYCVVVYKVFDSWMSSDDGEGNSRTGQMKREVGGTLAIPAKFSLGLKFPTAIGHS